MTGAEWQDYLVRLATEAYDRAWPSAVDDARRRDARHVFVAQVRERMAQAAQTIVLEDGTARDGGVK